ncbi:SRPBCC family protein [Ideonella azotifigens]|uniref:SRPBCC family protein n=1 Tax=Ideonella azotifigens TaxID=513160 RepID=A0ABN1K2W4_9BURK|nr:SRPBCC family protein [Ideonella azotifigens]MCD2344583.1 SRPBCC family protein [Ideonella azotifigens]
MKSEPATPPAVALPAIGQHGRDMLSHRLLDAPPERVFRAFADPTQLAQWWGPAGFRNTFAEFDFRPGGRWRFVMHAPDGSDFPNESVFAQVVAPELIVFDHLSGHHFEMTLRLEPVGTQQTRVHWQQRFDTEAECDRIAAFVVVANEQNLDRLAAVLAGLALDTSATPVHAA